MKILLLLLAVVSPIRAGVYFWTVGVSATTNYLVIPQTTTLDIVTNGMAMTFINTFDTASTVGQADWWIFKGVIQWIVFPDGTSPNNSMQWKIYYEGPARSGNRWSSGLFAPPNPTVSPALNIVNAFTIIFGNNTSQKGMTNGVVSGAGTWTTGGTDLDIALASNIEMGRGQGSHSYRGKFSEFAFWNTNLTYQQLLTLNNGHLKRLPLQVMNGNIKVYLPLDEAPENVRVTTTNYFRDLSNNYNPASPIGGILGRTEMVCSYPPNE